VISRLASEWSIEAAGADALAAFVLGGIKHHCAMQ
jgi:hypothetical protein